MFRYEYQLCIDYEHPESMPYLLLLQVLDLAIDEGNPDTDMKASA